MIQLEGLDDGYNVITSEKKQSSYKFLYQVNLLINSHKQYTQFTKE